MTPINPDDLLRDELAEHHPMWKAVADTLDEWQWRMHGAASSHHNVGAFLRFLDKHGYEVAAKSHRCPDCPPLTITPGCQHLGHIEVR